MSSENRTMVIVDAAFFPHSPDDLVERGETLGLSGGRTVVAPFRSTIESVSFDSDHHTLHVVLKEAR